MKFISVFVLQTFCCYVCSTTYCSFLVNSCVLQIIHLLFHTCAYLCYELLDVI